MDVGWRRRGERAAHRYGANIGAAASVGSESVGLDVESGDVVGECAVVVSRGCSSRCTDVALLTSRPVPSRDDPKCSSFHVIRNLSSIQEKQKLYFVLCEMHV